MTNGSQEYRGGKKIQSEAKSRSDAGRDIRWSTNFELSFARRNQVTRQLAVFILRWRTRRMIPTPGTYCIMYTRSRFRIQVGASPWGCYLAPPNALHRYAKRIFYRFNKMGDYVRKSRPNVRRYGDLVSWNSSTKFTLPRHAGQKPIIKLYATNTYATICRLSVSSAFADILRSFRTRTKGN